MAGCEKQLGYKGILSIGQKTPISGIQSIPDFYYVIDFRILRPIAKGDALRF